MRMQFLYKYVSSSLENESFKMFLQSFYSIMEWMRNKGGILQQHWFCLLLIECKHSRKSTLFKLRHRFNFSSLFISCYSQYKLRWVNFTCVFLNSYDRKITFQDLNDVGNNNHLINSINMVDLFQSGKYWAANSIILNQAE